MKELQKKIGVGSESTSAKNGRKMSAHAAKRGRGKIEVHHNPLAEVKLLHPKSRRAKQLMRSFEKDNKKVAHRHLLDTKLRLKSHKARWYKDYIFDPSRAMEFVNLKCITKERLVEITVEYLRRHDVEIGELKEKRAGNHYRATFESGREKELTTLRDEETNQAKGGLFEAPFLTSKKGFAALREWEVTSLETLYTIPWTEIEVAEVPYQQETFAMGDVGYKRLADLKRKFEQRKTRASGKASALDTSKPTVNLEQKKEERTKETETAIKSRRAALVAAKRKGVAAPEGETGKAKESEAKKKNITKAAQREERAKQVAESSAFKFGGEVSSAPKVNPFL